MKKLFLNLSLLVSSFTAFAQIPTNGLQLYYPFNGNTNDLSGNNRNGTNNGATLTTDRFGKDNSAYYFNGTSSFINSNYAFSPTIASSYTISFWYKTDTITDSKPVLSKSVYEYNYLVNPTKNNGITTIQWNGTTGVNYYQDSYNSTTPKFGNGWSHYCIVYQNKSVNIYIDGVLNTSNTSTATLENRITNNPTLIGYGYVNSSIWRYFKGSIDDIRIYNQTITPVQVSALYNECNIPKPTFADVNKCYDTTSFSYSATNGYTNKWYNSNNQLINNGTTFKTKLYYNRDTTYKYLVSNILGNCESDKDTLVFNIKSVPYVSLSVNTTGGLLYINSNQQTINTYPTGGILKLNNKVVNTTYTPSLNGLGKKDFTYTYTASNECSNTTNMSIIVFDTVHCVSGSDTLIIKSNATTGINLPSDFGIVKLYPNPANDVLNITYNNPSANYKINIINSQSQVVYSNNLNLNTYQVSLNGLAKGLYFVQIIDNNTSKVLETSKLLIE